MVRPFFVKTIMISREEIFCGNIRKFPTIFSALLFEKKSYLCLATSLFKYLGAIFIDSKGMRHCGAPLFYIPARTTRNTQQKKVHHY